MIRCEVRFEIARRPAEVFAFVDDVHNAPRWLSRCTGLQQTSAPPKGVGTTLRYFYKDPGGHTGEMAGVVTDYERDKRLAMRMTDRTLRVGIFFRFASKGSGTEIDHTVEITPRTFLMRLMSPMIRGATQKQITRDTAKLKELLESGAAPAPAPPPAAA